MKFWGGALRSHSLSVDPFVGLCSTRSTFPSFQLQDRGAIRVIAFYQEKMKPKLELEELERERRERVEVVDMGEAVMGRWTRVPQPNSAKYARLRTAQRGTLNCTCTCHVASISAGFSTNSVCACGPAGRPHQ